MIVKMKQKDVESAIERIAEYYKDSALYTAVSNNTNAKQFYIDEYSKDTELMVEQGFSYKGYGNYIIAIDPIKFKEDYPEQYEHYFGIVPVLDAVFEKDSKRGKYLFLPAFGPKNGTMDKSSHKLINEFLAKHKSYDVFTDFTNNIDTAILSKYTDLSEYMVNGVNYFRRPARG